MQTQTNGPVRASPRRNREGMICRQCPELPLRVQCPHSDEGRLYLAQLTSQNQNKAIRAPQRCSKCPNRPLRSQCQHTQTGRAFLLQQQIQVEVSGVMDTIPQPHPPAPQTPLSNRGLDPLVTPPSPQQVTAPPFTTAPSDDNIDPTLRQRYVPNSSPGPAPLSIDPPSIPAPPLAHSVPFNLPVTPRSTDNSSSIMTPSSQQEETSPSPTSTPSKPSRRHERTSKSNPYHGFVKGCMRGTQDHVIFRRHKRPEALVDSKEASKTFLDKINRLVKRAEDLSVKTGCWMFVGAQHPGASGATIHYTSPRLVRDAPDHVGEIVNDYHQLMSNLLQARRIEALNLSQKYQATLAQNQAMASRVADLESQMLTMQQSIDIYQARLFADEQAAATPEESPST